jgi:antibiotic biosynthesis monooxygenase (ABM) superfamily enzyme
MKNTLTHKTAFLSWLAIYPVMNIVSYFFDDVLMQVPLLFRTLILSAILVPLMTYLIMPLYTGLFKKWLEKQ